ncbi:citryl-CoA lyase [Roseibium sp. TrichSKD4]|uniref:HpcH/HpaI aldolase/citrate lyase family protein n=1 Tax=Roseibium sp. TrichSKD4 TaxID=744980 RepID=UPI0001E5683D|nr:CoA ester lyase [Roseibium sp. TrichSKD4]EFO31268.1 citryl-CoA lyase [Roseibium sp. TrichSKD4]
MTAPRTLLFVPATDKKRVQKASTLDVDVVILDLEDSIPPADKNKARGVLLEQVSSLKSAEIPVYVRVNAPFSLMQKDIHAALEAGANGLIVPKIESAAMLDSVAEFVAGNGAQSTRVMGLVETARGVARLPEIVGHKLLSLIAIGDEDLATDLGVDPASETIVAVKTALVPLAVANGVLPIGTAAKLSDFGDRNAFEEGCRRARAWGMCGTLCIHPVQVEIAQRIYAPTQQEIEWALTIVAASEASSGKGALGLDGQMIDAPILARAQRLLATNPEKVVRVKEP